jgi:hypothetical protein
MKKHLRSMLGLLALTIGGAAGVAAADTPAPPAAGADCAGHFTAEGSFFAGKKFNTWAEFAAVSKADLYTRVYTNVAKDGWQITSSDKDAGIISASQSVSFGRTIRRGCTPLSSPGGSRTRLPVRGRCPLPAPRARLPSPQDGFCEGW